MSEPPLQSPAQEHEALRTRVAVAPAAHLSAFRIKGAGAFDAVDQLVTSDLYLQHAQLRQTLLLDPEGLVVADALVGRDEEDYLLVLDGLDGPTAHDLVRSAAKDSSIDALADTHEVIGLHGPYAWELLGEWLGLDLVGMPYLSSFVVDGALVLRAGTTGEYGYEIFLPKDRAEALRAELFHRGKRFGLQEVSREGLELAALENGFFNIRREGRLVRDPLELQLRWRLSNGKDFVGSKAIVERSSQEADRRITWMVSDQPMAVGERIEAFGEPIGRIVNAGLSTTLGCWIGIASLSRRWAHAGIDAYARLQGEERTPVRTVAPPLLNNRSLHVSPQRHSYHTRESFDFPEIR